MGRSCMNFGEGLSPSVHFGQDLRTKPKQLNKLFKNFFYQIVNSFYRMMLCAVLAMGLCLSQVGVLLKRLNVGSHKQHHTIAQGL